MKDLRRARRCLAVAIMVEYIKEHQADWLADYERTYKEKTLVNVTRLCARFAKRHGFVRKAITTAKMTAEEMATKKDALSRAFWGKYGDKDPSLVLNCDETGIFYDMPPRKTLTEKKSDAVVDAIEKNSGRVTAVLTVRSDGTCCYDIALCLTICCIGKKLPILFIVKAKPGGVIEKQETKTYPLGHHYIVQKNAWMDARGWNIYLRELLKYVCMPVLARILLWYLGTTSRTTLCFLWTISPPTRLKPALQL